MALSRGGFRGGVEGVATLPSPLNKQKFLSFSVLLVIIIDIMQ